MPSLIVVVPTAKAPYIPSFAIRGMCCSKCNCSVIVAPSSLALQKESGIPIVCYDCLPETAEPGIAVITVEQLAELRRTMTEYRTATN